jgi:iron complex transport system substrate-binding protein
MLNRRQILAAPSALLSGGAAPSSLTVQDDLGRRVTVRVPVKRTVVFTRYAAEFVRAIAGTGVIVGDDVDPAKDGDYWPAATRAMMAGGQQHPNYEAIAALKPDLVLMARNSAHEEAARTLQPFGIPVLVLTAWDVLKHEQNVTLLGRLYGQPQRAEQLNAFYRRYRDLLAARLKGVARRGVYMEEVGDYQTLLPGSGWHDMMLTAGARNVFGDVDVLKQPGGRGDAQGFRVDPEEIIARRPEVIVKLQPQLYRPQSAEASRSMLDKIAARPGFAQLPAVQSGQVYYASYYLMGGCSKIIGALRLAKWLYPARFADIDPDAVMGEWLQGFQGMPSPGGWWISLAQLRALPRGR